MNPGEVGFMPACELAALLRRRKISAVEATQALLDRIQRLNPKLNAYATICEAEALEAARHADRTLRADGPSSPIHGMPFSVKDLVWTAGVRTTAGSRIFRDHVPEQDAVAVGRLLRAGAVLLGKTCTPEFGYKATTESPLFGVTRNPWDTTRTPGGSSGGAASATAAGLSPLSLGTDGGGSIRIPSSFCGIFGFKPTFGLVPGTPGFAGWRTLSHTGPMTRTVADAALMLDVMAGYDEGDRLSIPGSTPSYRGELEAPETRLHIGYSRTLGFATVSPEVSACVEEAIPVLRSLGHTVEECDLDLGEARRLFEVHVLAENFAANHGHVEAHRAVMDQALVTFIQMGAGISAADYLRALQGRDALCARLAAYFSEWDLLITPTVAVLPFPIGEVPREIEGVPIDALGWIPFTYPFNLAGNPAASIPCGRSEAGLPVGMQVVGPRHLDGLVLNLCAQYEGECPWWKEIPPVE